MTQAWYDGDGLYRKFGTDKTTANVAGEYRTNAALREIEIKLTLTGVGATNGGTFVSDQVFFPKARIEEVVVVTQTAATGTGAVLNLGLISTDRSTEIDYNGLIAALPLTSIDLAGEKTTLNAGSTYGGALLGTTTTSVGYLVADYDTAAFTAGVLYIRIRYTAA